MDPSNEWWRRPGESDDVELCACPECGLPAEVLRRGPTSAGELVGVRCVGRHWFLGLRDRLVA
ncbi:hypothetical protein [Kineosporia sp. R_H_3]|uniref:hypothetical protein n=1 Tax=Kineosporia sp. R_H_3 TaxID=1961848 RepID=UPI000B4C1A78|nr:hypothetical protein [Kineosporia sp. R_H_3]